MACEVDGARPKCRPKKTCQEVVESDLRNLHLDNFDAVHHMKWR